MGQHGQCRGKDARLHNLSGKDVMSSPKKPKKSSQGPICLWHGMTVPQLCKLFAAGPSLHWSKTLQLLFLPGFSVYNSLMSGLESLVYGRRIRNTQIEHPPLFLIGHWRSGTTLLHNLIAQDPRLTYPTMYDVVFPNHFLLTRKVVTRLTRSLVPKTRPMDNMPAGWDIPQEEDIAMAILTFLTPYIQPAFPDQYEKVERLWDMSQLTERERAFWVESYQWLLKKITLRDQKQLVLKSPINTMRIPLLLEMFPEAKFVYIYRNPFNVFHSCVHLERSLYTENTLGKPTFEGTRRQTIRLMKRSFEVYERDKHLIPQGHLCEVRFEDLEQNPLAELERIYQTIDLPGFETLEEIIRPQLLQLRNYKKNRYSFTREEFDELYNELAELFEARGYAHPSKLFGHLAA